MYYVPHLKRWKRNIAEVKWLITVWVAGRQVVEARILRQVCLTSKINTLSRTRCSLSLNHLIPECSPGQAILMGCHLPVSTSITHVTLLNLTSPPQSVLQLRLWWGEGVWPANDAFPIAPQGIKCSTDDPRTIWRLECQPPCCQKSAYNFDSPQTKLLVVSCWPEAWSITVNTCFECYEYYILYAYNKLNYRKEDIIKRIIRK